MEHRQPTVVATTWNDSEARVIKSLLESYSIPCHYAFTKIPQYLYPLPIQGLGDIQIYVPAPLAEEAQRILREHKRKRHHLYLVDDEGVAAGDS